jgi:hypothetical protein
MSPSPSSHLSPLGRGRRAAPGEGVVLRLPIFLRPRAELMMYGRLLLRINPPEAVGEEIVELRLFLPHEAALGQLSAQHQVDHRA